MALNQTPAAERIHIGFFGRRNAGKSSVMNAVTGQNLAVVSDVKGTTTDPVQKTMELLPLGPVMMIDTPGIDDEGQLGQLRVKKSRQVLNRVDLAVLVVDALEGMKREDREMEELFQKKNVPYLIVYNKTDLLKSQVDEEKSQQVLEKSQEVLGKNPGDLGKSQEVLGKSPEDSAKDSEHVLYVSAVDGTGIMELKERLAHLRPADEERDLLEGLVKPGDLAVLVTPIDKAAPKGRMILPQQQTIRALLDHGCLMMVVREAELEDCLLRLKEKPDLVITDSQVFGFVSSVVPQDVKLTSFSILFARYKGNLAQAVESVQVLDQIQDGDKILISEGCTHHRQCNDIGTVKLPGWIRGYTGKEPEFCYTSGTEFPEDLTPYRLIVHCGGCMLNEREMKYRQACARDQQVPMTNYGILIAYVNGILKRSVAPMKEIAALLENS